MRSMPDPYYAIVFDPKLTLDGVLTFVGGALALLGMWIQSRHADKGLQRQLNAERQAREQERARRKRALARAILFELDNFYRIYLRDPRPVLLAVDAKACAVGQLPAFRTPGDDPFPIMRSNASELGELDERYIRDIVRFYGEADAYLRTAREYSQHFGKLVLEGSTYLPVNFMTRSCLGQLQNSAQEMINLTFLVSKELCTLASVEFKIPLIGVAGEPDPEPDLIRQAGGTSRGDVTGPPLLRSSG
jgi:hypothetical protein